jgi:HK97 family phage portal protein
MGPDDPIFESRAIEPTSAAWMRLVPGWADPTVASSCSPEEAIKATPVFAAVDFLSSALATVSLHVYRRDGDGAARIETGIGKLLGECVNDEWSSFRWRKYSFWQTLTGGRQFTWIERPNGQILNLWPLDPTKVTVKRSGGRTIYEYREGSRAVEYAAADIIDIPFALEADQVTHVSPLKKCEAAIALLRAMEKYAATFFAGGGVLPLALIGPAPTGDAAMKRMMDDVNRVIKRAKDDGKQIFPLPPGYDLKNVGFDPEKGQMTEARRLQVEEVARIYSLPPWFLQDLTNANFANSENQDLHLVKHTLSHWVKAAEQEMNLKLFGRRNSTRWVEFNMDSLLRGDFQTRAEGIAKLIQVGVMSPNDGRNYIGGLEPSEDPNADTLHMQGATVPLGTQPASSLPPNDGAGPGTSDN